MNNLHVKKDQMVVVLSGADKGKTGKVLAVYPEKRRVLVEGIRMVTKALKKSQDNPKGGIIKKEAPIPVAKVMGQEAHEARAKKRQAAGTVA